MRNNQFNRERSERWSPKNRGKKNIILGIFFVIIGGLLLAQKSGVDFPSWFFTWPVLLIGIGLVSGLRHNFKSGPWFILLIVGGVFLADRISDDLYLRPYFWPILFIAAGFFIISGGYFSRKRAIKSNDDPDSGITFDPAETGDHSLDAPAGSTAADNFTDSASVLDVTAIFAGVKKNVLSKNFKGGDIVSVMGGSEINLSKADFNNKVVIDCFTMFGGTKLIVPPDWDIQSNVVAIFGGVDDKRPASSMYNLSKVLYLEGTCLFGGIEIRSY